MKTLINKIGKHIHISKPVLIEILLMTLLFVSPLMLLYYNEVEIKHEIEMLILCWSICILFLLNYIFFVPRCLLYANKKIFKFILINTLLIILLSVFMFFVEEKAREHHHMHKQIEREEILFEFPSPSDHIDKHDGLPPFDHKKPPVNIMFLISKVLPMIFAVGATIGIRTITEIRVQRKKINELKHSYAAAELKNLRKQFSPHFLFNTLNSIYALIDISPEMSKDAIVRLSNMMRKVMVEYKTFHCVPLSESMALLKDYIELMKLRTNENLDLKISLPSKTESFYIPPLLFIVLVENAFKHGVIPSRKSFVYINIVIEDGKTIICEVENSYFGDKVLSRKKSGDGIEDLQKRLDIIYPSEYTLTMNHDDKKYIAKLVIPIKREEKFLC
ncbi:MAG: histidine kinase [Bacteroidaceae bacterium]|nr:histidine kinase [Bacteroidaceae bacterium]